MNKKATLCFGIMLTLCSVSEVRSSSRTTTLLRSGWIVYWDVDRGEKTVRDLRGTLDDLCLFAYNFDGEGHLVPGGENVPNQVLLWKNRKIGNRPKLWVTVVNDKVSKESVLYKDPLIVHHVLSDPAARQTHLEELLRLSKDADGLEIDYENLDPADRVLFTKFAADLGNELHARGQSLSIVLEPRTEKQEKIQGPGAMDWPELSKAADRLRIMAYFLHYSGGDPGPTAPPAWVSDIVNFALRQIPKEKIDIAFCLDGIDWPSKGPGTESTYEPIEDRRKKYKAPRRRSARGEPPYYSYMDGKDIHQVWYEDAESLKEKIRRVQVAGLARVSFWRLGEGDPAFWKWLAAQKGNPKLKK